MKGNSKTQKSVKHCSGPSCNHRHALIRWYVVYPLPSEAATEYPNAFKQSDGLVWAVGGGVAVVRFTVHPVFAERRLRRAVYTR